MRDYLPAVETDRQVNDWGRSERVEGLFDKTLVDFFYNYWFRADVEGIENVPSNGGALLVSNHSGALPPDATQLIFLNCSARKSSSMIMKRNSTMIAPA